MTKFYIATAIPYVNDKPHLGHAILHLYADVLARYHRQKNEDVLFSAGTDEHGGKVAEAAEKAGKDPNQFVDEVSAKFREGLKKLEISNDRFIRTTDADHEKRAQTIWKTLSKDIYKKSYVGWYCTGCEEFKTDTYVKETKGICPLHNRPYEKLEEENYFFALSKYTDKVKQAIESDQYKIVPTTRKHEILALLKEGLQDISVSRPSEKIAWGIPVPGDPDQTMYVWFEALMNYITVLSYPDGEDFKKYWPADVQVIGKDILRFHAAIWPGILLGLGIDLPKNLYVHGFVTSEGQKMSKSLGNVVDPLDMVDEYGIDAFRYYFLKYGPAANDVDFTWEEFKRAYNNELADELGNLVSRLAAMIEQYRNGQLEPKKEAIDKLAYEKALADFRFDKAIEAVWQQIRDLNQFIEQKKPWELAKTGKTKELDEALFGAAGRLLNVADLLIPLLPETAAKITDTFSKGKVANPGILFPKKEG